MSLEALVARVPAKYRKLYTRTFEGAASPLQAIRAKCLECVAWHRHDGGDDRVAGCAARGCPLWSLRPFQARQVPQRATSGADTPLDGKSLVASRDAR